jgi:predicted amidohydrolase YtcJ
MGVDGGLVGRTAALRKDYAGGGYKGSFRVEQAVLDRSVQRASQAGFSVGLICQGDAGIERSLEAVARDPLRADRRHRLEHAYAWAPDLIDRMAELGLVWNTQPPILPVTAPYLPSLLGQRARWAFPFRSLLERGVRISGGSDWGVGSYNPFLGIDALVNHTGDVTPNSLPFNADETVSIHDAIRIYTMGGAFADGREDEVGSIEIGKRADLVVLDRDLTRPDCRYRDTRVLRTYLGGRLVYDSAGGETGGVETGQ